MALNQILLLTYLLNNGLFDLAATAGYFAKSTNKKI